MVVSVIIGSPVDGVVPLGATSQPLNPTTCERVMVECLRRQSPEGMRAAKPTRGIQPL